MKVRTAKISDAGDIYSLINFYAGEDKMLFRSMADIYENLQTFSVVELDGSVVGCCALQVIWSDLAEIKSLAVEQAHTSKGAGKSLLSTVIKQARQIGVPRVFALAQNPALFKKMGFRVIKKETLPMKVWSDCAKCPKQQNCDEVAVIKRFRTKS